MLKRHGICVALFTIFAILMLESAKSPFAAAPEPVPVLVQPKPLVHLSLGQSASFSEALDALAAQGHIAIVAEGAPLVPRLPAKEVQDLTAPVSLSVAVTKIAASFDYNVQKQDNVFVLTKRYTDPKEMPCVTLEECRRAFKDILTLLDKYNPNFDEASEDHSKHNTVIAFFNSLSPGQLQEAQAKTLHYGELTPEQQGMVNIIFLCGFVQFPTHKLRETVDRLDYAPKSVLTGKDKGRSALLIEFPVPADKSLRYLQPLEGGISPTDAALPLILPKRQGKSTSVTPAPMTLETLMGLLPHTGPPSVVDACLKDKPVSAAGLKNVSSMDVLRALKVLYNLRIGASDAGGNELMRQIPPNSDSLRDIGPGVWSLLPISIVRAIHQGDAPTGQAAPINESKTENLAEARQRFRAEADRRFRQQMRSQTSLPTLWTEAVQQVIVGVQPQFRSGGLSVRIPVRTLDNTTRCALATALSASVLEELQNGFTGLANQNVLDCLDDMNDTLVYTVSGEAAVIHGRTVPSLYFAGTNPYTKQQIGLGGARFFTHK